jgi:hypothetical protein
MRAVLVWVISALFIVLALILSNAFGISKHIFTIWFGTIYMIVISFKRYNDEKYSAVINRTIIGTIGIFIIALILTAIEVYLMMNRELFV